MKRRALFLLGIIYSSNAAELPCICLNDWFTRNEGSQPLFNATGDIKESMVLTLLQESNALDHHLFDETYRASSLMNEKGSHTKQLFLIHSNDKEKPSYILKEVDPSIATMEIASLKKLVAHKKLEPITAPHSRPGIPTLYLPIAYYYYTYQGTKHALYLMYRAPGINLGSFMATFKQNQGREHITVARVYRELGAALARLNGAFPGNSYETTSFTHGDLHQKNIFYHEPSKEFALIDNACARVANDQDSSQDILQLFYLNSNYHVSCLVNHSLLELWQQIILSNLLIGYLSPFTVQMQKKVSAFLYKKFRNHPDYKKHKKSIESAFTKIESGSWKTYKLPAWNVPEICFINRFPRNVKGPS